MAGSDGGTGSAAQAGNAFSAPEGLDAALAPLYANVASRLRTACAHMTPADFHALVLDIARMKLRWSGEHPAVSPAMAPLDDGRGNGRGDGVGDVRGTGRAQSSHQEVRDGGAPT